MNFVDIKTDKSLGYLYFIDKTHPMANKQGRVYHHRHVMMMIVGRPLGSNEHVHHKDGDRSNNDPSNLELLSSSDHMKVHNPKTIRTPKKCCSCGNFTLNKIACSPQCLGVFTRTTTHGTYSMYQRRKCRCSICMDGNNERSRRFRERKPSKEKQQIRSVLIREIASANLVEGAILPV